MSDQPKPLSDADRLSRENARLRGDLLTFGNRISHDLRTPLGSILNTTELLREVAGEKDAAVGPLTTSIGDSVDEMMRLIKSFSMLARASGGPVTIQPVRMEEIVSGILQQLESKILKKGATVDFPDSWPEVNGVATWVEFAWWNFITNAIQHGGNKIQLGWTREGSEHRFWIADDGPGVPARLRARLFQTFDSLHEPSSMRGLGLSTVQRLVDLQGGRCGHEAENAAGTYFYFTLPMGDVSQDTRGATVG